MSFGVIFSIILIVFFIVIAIIVINAFLKSRDCAQIGMFLDRLEDDVKSSWNSQKDIHEFKGNIPSNIDYVCFADLTAGSESEGEAREIWRDINIGNKEHNLFFSPRKKSCDIPSYYVPHLDIERITSSENPYCVEVIKGKVSFDVIKRSTSGLVEIK